MPGFGELAAYEHGRAIGLDPFVVQFALGDRENLPPPIHDRLALLLNDWRQKTNDVIPSDFAGTRISERYTQTYAHINGIPYPSRSAVAIERGIKAE